MQREAYDCTTAPNPQPDGIANHIAVFAFSIEKDMIYGQPLNYIHSIIITEDIVLRRGNIIVDGIIYHIIMLWIDISLDRALY